jgi:hypothetical protein
MIGKRHDVRLLLLVRSYASPTNDSLRRAGHVYLRSPVRLTGRFALPREASPAGLHLAPLRRAISKFEIRNKSEIPTTEISKLLALTRPFFPSGSTAGAMSPLPWHPGQPPERTGACGTANAREWPRRWGRWPAARRVGRGRRTRRVGDRMDRIYQDGCGSFPPQHRPGGLDPPDGRVLRPSVQELRA